MPVKPSLTQTVQATVERSKDDAVLNEESQAPAYPFVQPLKASLYFDSAQGFGDWRIYIGTDAVRALRQHSKNRPTFEIIVKKIRFASMFSEKQ